jgi:hypothetical protein
LATGRLLADRLLSDYRSYPLLFRFLGHVTSLVCGHASINVVQAIERSVRTNNEISDVDSNIVEIIRRRHGGTLDNRNVAFDDDDDDESINEFNVETK